MISSNDNRLPAPRRPAAPDASGWHWLTLYTMTDVEPFIAAVLRALAAAGFGDRDQFAVRLALEEAVVNAIKHGHRGDTSKAVRVGYRVTAAEFTARVEDQGDGFNPNELPDPLDPENLERTSGRGVFLMRAYMTYVEYNDRGNCLTLGKRR